MNKAVLTSFLVIMVLVAVILFYDLTFHGDDGIFVTAHDAIAEQVNMIYSSSRGDGTKLMPVYKDADNKNTLKKSDFDMSVE